MQLVIQFEGRRLMFMKLDDPIALEAVLVDSSQSRREVFVNFLADRGLRIAASLDHLNELLNDEKLLAKDRYLFVIYTEKNDPAILENLRKLRATTMAPILVFTDEPELEFVSIVAKAGADQVVPMGLQTDRISVGTSLALEAARKRQKLTRERDKALARLADGALITRAKSILIERHDMSETSAHAKIQQLSMEKNLTLPDMAKAIIEAENLLCSTSS